MVSHPSRPRTPARQDQSPPEVSEADRLATLAAYGILDTDPEAGFDDIARLAAQICGTPIAAVSFVDAQRQWFKASVGLGEVRETDRSLAFCARAIEAPGDILVVDDAARDPRFADNLLVTGEPRIRFYAGAPMVTLDGAALGTVCVIDLAPRQLAEDQLEALRALGRQAMVLLETRRALDRLAVSVGARERAEDRARAATERLRMTFRKAPVGMMIARASDGVVEEVNEAFAAMLGRNPEDLTGVPFMEITGEEDRSGEAALAERARAGEIDTVVRQKSYRHADGSLVPAISTASVIRGQDGAPAYLLSHVQGIADRRQAEEGLLETQSVTDAIITVDSGDLITAWNTGATKLFGYEYAEVIGKPLTMVIPERFRSAHVAGVQRVRTGGEPVRVGRTVEVQALRRDGSEFPAELSISGWLRGGQPFYTGLVRDITERRTAEEHASLLRAAAVAANTAPSVEAALLHVLNAVSSTTGWSGGRAWLLTGTRHVLAAQWPATGEVSPVSEGSPLPDSTELVALVTAARETVVLPATAGSRVGTPVFAGDVVVALLEFGLPAGAPPPDATMVGVLEQVGTQLGRVVERTRAAAEISVRTEQLAEAQSLAKLGSWSLDLVTGDMSWSDELFRICGLAPGSIEPSLAAFKAFVHPDDRHLLDRVRDYAADTGFEAELRLIRSDGCQRILHSRGRLVRDEDGGRTRLVGSGQDVTERRELEQELLRQAVTDPLTGLGNRAGLMSEVETAIAAGVGTPTALWVDVDGLKGINDSLGHGVGDALVRICADRLRGALRPQDTIARVGGGEFAVLLTETTPARSLRVAARLQAEVARPAEVAGMSLELDATIGVAHLKSRNRSNTVPAPPVADNATALVRSAALAAGRSDGGRRIVVYEPGMHARAERWLRLHAELRRARERGQLQVYYQPTVDLRSGRLLGAEALLRWSHPELGAVSPVEFIPLAEETGLILDIGRWVLAQACRQAAEWSPRRGWAGLPSVSVNLSGRQLSDDRIVADVAKVLAETQLDASRLTMEITESVLMSDADRTVARLRELRRLGVRIAIDDFGTGYSSLGYLSRFPVDVLKVDKSFVDDIATSDRSRMLAAGVVALGRTLGMTILAEGVETEVQRDTLEHLGCENGQGYLFGRPMPPGDFAHVLPVPMRAVRSQRAG